MKKTNILLSAIIGLVFANNAQAIVITDSFSNAHETTEISQNGTLDKFDASLGTLNSVTLTLSGDSISSTVLENTSANSQFFNFDSILNFFFDVSSVGVPAPAFTTVLGTTGGFVNLASGASLDLGSTADSGSYTVTLTNPSDTSAFLASATMATFDVSCNTISGTTFNGGGGNINNLQDTTAACGAEISYDYAETTPVPVPEPTALWLLGAGLLGLIGLRKSGAI